MHESSYDPNFFRIENRGQTVAKSKAVQSKQLISPELDTREAKGIVRGFFDRWRLFPKLVTTTGTYVDAALTALLLLMHVAALPLLSCLPDSHSRISLKCSCLLRECAPL
jgi:hypothetical protein